MPQHHTKLSLKKGLAIAKSRLLPKNKWLRRISLVVVALVLLFTGTSYGIAQWYIHGERSKPLELGVSFIPYYASSLGVDPQQTFDGLLGIGVKHFRLVSYWNAGEPNQGSYDFSALDWQFAKAEKAGAHITLTVGLRQPRWPECHMPDWAKAEPTTTWTVQLEAYMKAVVERYKNSPALENYQLENEYFLKGFGECTDYSRQRLVNEYALVKQTDPRHPVIVGRSNNDLGTPIGDPTPDEYSVSVYKRVWDAGFTHRYLEYPFPAWSYATLAGVQKITKGKDMVIGELQAEAWPPNGKTIPEISLAEQNKSMNAKRLKDRFQYGEATGMRGINLWGGEYWYYRLTVLHDPSLWNVAKQEFKNAE
ncbi:MAG: hypothetical protein JWN38_194 [Candidatus Saccharibacteria bacterium]|nr:hypothetical protein [Candidatus Saccharibacteria bacterium]